MLPVQITFRNSEPSPALEEAISARAQKLLRLSSRITSCHVVVEAPGLTPPLHGRPFHVLVDVKLPGKELPATADDENVRTAIERTFACAERELASYVGRRRVRH